MMQSQGHTVSSSLLPAGHSFGIEFDFLATSVRHRQAQKWFQINPKPFQQTSF